MLTIPQMQFPAMGSTCRVAVLGGNTGSLFELAQRRVAELEQRWSRFTSSSELSQIYAETSTMTQGVVTKKVSTDTLLLIDHGVYAWRATNGTFDPSVLGSMNAAGYDESFEKLKPRVTPTRLLAAPGCGGITVNLSAQTVTFPAGVGFDAGGIGKGLAADLTVEALLDSGADGASVNLGGDLRVSGQAPDGGWSTGVQNPFDPDDLVSVVVLSNHGFATSNRLIRQWSAGDEQHNHLLHPGSGKSASNVVSSSVISGQAWWSEVLAKLALLDPSALNKKIPLLGGATLNVNADRSIKVSGGYEHFERARL